MCNELFINRHEKGKETRRRRGRGRWMDIAEREREREREPLKSWMEIERKTRNNKLRGS